MARPVIALLTDFGSRDHYVGAMKGVAIGICPDASLIDITHDVPPHDVLAGALELAASYKYFPAGTVFVAVVDPGVGSSRRAIAVEAGDYLFVAPDNGVLTVALREQPLSRTVELTERKYAGATVSRTFEGRDRFAPAAAWLAKGVDLALLGPTVASIQRLDVPEAREDSDGIAGEVLRVDRFGNLITNINRTAFERLNGRAFVVTSGPHVVSKIVSTYGDVARGEICALFGSSDHLEIAANGESAADRLTLGRGASVHVSRRA
ncbi:MAG TPA: SAM-dependent chlorinase/fluorinase [Vicinamibacterales bacterium]